MSGIETQVLKEIAQLSPTAANILKAFAGRERPRPEPLDLARFRAYMRRNHYAVVDKDFTRCFEELAKCGFGKLNKGKFTFHHSVVAIGKTVFPTVKAAPPKPTLVPPPVAVKPGNKLTIIYNLNSHPILFELPASITAEQLTNIGEFFIRLGGRTFYEENLAVRAG